MMKKEIYAWRAVLKDGMRDEYIKRHDEIWPEMIAVLKEAGIENYSIWNAGNELFGYYECAKGIAFAAKTQERSPVVARWNEYMEDVMTMVFDLETGAQLKMTTVFYLA
jgi:L-rhamnose mutarotase